MTKAKSGVGMILQERQNQVVRGYTIATDSKYHSREALQKAAVAIIHQYEPEWPENDIPVEIFKFTLAKSKVEQLAIAGAFIGASIDYITHKEVVSDTDSVVNQIIATEDEIEQLDKFIRYYSPGIVHLAAPAPKYVLGRPALTYTILNAGPGNEIVSTVQTAINTEGTKEFNDANYDSLLEHSIDELDIIINTTPSGDVRNALCDINIHLQHLRKIAANNMGYMSIQVLWEEYKLIPDGAFTSFANFLKFKNILL